MNDLSLSLSQRVCVRFLKFMGWVIGAVCVGGIVLSASMLQGCAHIPDWPDVNWPPAVTNVIPVPPPTPEPEPPPAVEGDEVDYSQLEWCFGGFNGSRAVYRGNVTIAGLTHNPSWLYYRFVKDLRGWGVTDPSNSDNSICAAFFKCADGKWRGGKFDWVSSNRQSRETKHMYSGYNGWDMSIFEDITDVCYVVVRRDGGERSNVIMATGYHKKRDAGVIAGMTRVVAEQHYVAVLGPVAFQDEFFDGQFAFMGGIGVQKDWVVLGPMVEMHGGIITSGAFLGGIWRYLSMGGTANERGFGGYGGLAIPLGEP